MFITEMPNIFIEKIKSSALQEIPAFFGSRRFDVSLQCSQQLAKSEFV